MTATAQRVKPIQQRGLTASTSPARPAPEPAAAAAVAAPAADAATLRLRHRDHVARRQQRNLALAALVGASLFVVTVYLPTGWRLADLNKRIESDSGRLQVDATRASELPHAEEAADEIEASLRPFKPMPSDPRLGDFIAHVTETTTRLRLRDVNLKPGEIVREDPLARLPVELSFTGDFVNVFDFLRITESLPRPLRVRAITVKQSNPAGGGSEGEVDVSMTISLFFRPTQGTAAN